MISISKTHVPKAKHKHQLTAVIYDKKGRVLSIGKNSYTRTHPVQAALARAHGTPEKVYIHAEVDAILRCKDLTKAYRIVVTRVGRSGELLLACPCGICSSYIKASGIKIVEHS